MTHNMICLQKRFDGFWDYYAVQLLAAQSVCQIVNPQSNFLQLGPRQSIPCAGFDSHDHSDHSNHPRPTDCFGNKFVFGCCRKHHIIQLFSRADSRSLTHSLNMWPIFNEGESIIDKAQTSFWKSCFSWVWTQFGSASGFVVFGFRTRSVHTLVARWMASQLTADIGHAGCTMAEAKKPAKITEVSDCINFSSTGLAAKPEQ